MLSAVADASWPRRFTDALGRQVTVAKPPQRILPLFSSNTEIVASLGAVDRIVGIDGLTKAPPEVLHLPRVGNRIGFSADLIARLRPDLIILTPARHAAASLLRPMEIAGIPVAVLTHPTVAAVMDNIHNIGWLIGEEANTANVIADMQAKLNLVQQHISGEKPKSVYFETGSSARGRSVSVRPHSYTDDLLRLAGGRTVFPALSSLSQVSGEAVRLANPDVIVVAGDQSKAEAIQHRPGWNSIPAVAGGRVFAVPRALFLIPGPRIAAGADCLARKLHPNAFAHVSNMDQTVDTL